MGKVEPVAFVKPSDVDCLAFEDGHSWPPIYRHQTDTHSMPLYSQATVDALQAEVERLRAMIGVPDGVLPSDAPRAITRAEEWCEKFLAAQARATLAEAEVEALRVRADAMAGEAIKHEARAERLAEALRGLVEYVQETAHHNAPAAAAAARAALRDHDQEVDNG